MKRIEVSARTVDEAISQGLSELGASISDVTVDILEEGSKGLFGLFGSKPAKIAITLNEEDNGTEVQDIFSNQAPAKKEVVKKQPIEKKQAPKVEKPVVKEKKEQAPKKPVQKIEKVQETEEVITEKIPVVMAEQKDRDTKEGKAQYFLQEVTRMMGVSVQVHVTTDEENNIHVDMQGDTLGILIGRRGETLDALQYLTSLQVNKGQSEYTRVTLDTENYRAKREEALVRLANRMANRAKKTGRKVSMEPMNPYERRILHSALQNNTAVETRSEGDEPNRHIVITLKSQN